MSLKEYAKKRDFEKTAEPEPKLSPSGKGPDDSTEIRLLVVYEPD